MVRINLLDWRQAQREQRQKNFFIAAGATAVFGALIWFVAATTVDGWISHQNARNDRLKSEIAVINKQIKRIEELEKLKADLLARMKIVEQLQQSRSQMVHFFEELATTLPDGVYLKTVSQKGNTTTVSGLSESNGRVSTYIRNLDRSTWFSNPRLGVIKTSPKAVKRESQFQLSFNLGGQKKDDDDEEEL